MSLKIVTIVAACFLLAACDSDGVADKSPSDAMTREAVCVVASERFELYKEAERHVKHGIDDGAQRFEGTGEVNDFYHQVDKARHLMARQDTPKRILAGFLAFKCGTPITTGEFDR